MDLEEQIYGFKAYEILKNHISIYNTVTGLHNSGKLS